MHRHFGHLLCLQAVSLAGTLPLLAGTAKQEKPPADRAALYVSRFTFGARPGEVDRVRAFGPERWFEQQLQPSSIPDQAFQQRMQNYPAMLMTPEERLARYPTPTVAMRLAKNDGPLPDDPERRAILTDQIDFYRMRREAKSGGAASPAGGTGQVTTGMAPQAANPAQTMNFKEQLESVEPTSKPEIEHILALSPNERYQLLLQMPLEQLIALRKGLKAPNLGSLGEGMTPLQRETIAALTGTNPMLSGELYAARLLRATYSDRELEAVMTDFWLNHFNVFIFKDSKMISMLSEYEKTIREHALGSFEDLLVATAQSPAMLMYLDNADSIGPDSLAVAHNPAAKKRNGLNENYARELMELHTLGVNGGYTQADVTEVAKVFTGWGIDRPNEGDLFQFQERRHEPGPKTVLGQTIAEGGEEEGLRVLHMLAESPATAHFISQELAVRFVSDQPPASLVDRMSAAWMQSHGDIRTVLRTMAHSPEFLTANTMHAKLKTPEEYIVSALRATNAEVSNPAPLAQALQIQGMPLYGCSVPTGYKWDSATWLSSGALVARLNFALQLAGNKLNGTAIDIQALESNANAAPTTPEEKERVLEQRITGPVSERTRQAVLAQAATVAGGQAMPAMPPDAAGLKRTGMPALNVDPARPAPPPADPQSATMLGLLIGSPEFQRR